MNCKNFAVAVTVLGSMFCGEYVEEGAFDPIEFAEESALSAAAANKHGATCTSNTGNTNCCSDLANLSASWTHKWHWGNTISCSGVEYVPNIWGTDWPAERGARSVRETQSGTGVSWASLEQVRVEGGGYASALLRAAPNDVTRRFEATIDVAKNSDGWTQNNMPADAILTGIKVEIVRNVGAVNGNFVTDAEVRLRRSDGALSSNLARTTTWSTGAQGWERATYGDAANKWGLAWSVSDLIANGITVVVSAKFKSPPVSSANVLIDAIAVRLFWVPGSVANSSAYILGFNEPNQRSQADLSPDDAAVLWKAIQDRFPSRKLIAPVTAQRDFDLNIEKSTGGYKWLTDFYARFVARYGTPPRLQGLAVHCYDWRPPFSPQYCKNLVQAYRDLANQWNVPEIWVTEWGFGPGDYVSTWNDGDYSKVEAAIADFVGWLQSHPGVTRYAYFGTRSNGFGGGNDVRGPLVGYGNNMPRSSSVNELGETYACARDVALGVYPSIVQCRAQRYPSLKRCLRPIALTNQFVRVNSDTKLKATATSCDQSSQFYLKTIRHYGARALIARANWKWVSSEAGESGDKKLTANRNFVGWWERFTQQDNADGTTSFRAAVNNAWVACEVNQSDKPLVANRTSVGWWEKFALTAW